MCDDDRDVVRNKWRNVNGVSFGRAYVSYCVRTRSNGQQHTTHDLRKYRRYFLLLSVTHELCGHDAVGASTQLLLILLCASETSGKIVKSIR